MFILKELPFSPYSNVSLSTHCTFCLCAFKITVSSFGYDSLPFLEIEILSFKSTPKCHLRSPIGLRKRSSTYVHPTLYPF